MLNPILSAEDAENRVTELTGVPHEDLFGRRRFKPIADARMLYYWILRTQMHWSLTRIADHLNVTHGAVINGVRAVENALKSEKLSEYRDTILEQGLCVDGHEKKPPRSTLEKRIAALEEEMAELKRLIGFRRYVTTCP